MKTRYKFLRTGYKSEIGDHKWKVGKWYEYDGDIEMCKSGFHCSKGIYQAFSHIRGEILAEVEVAGKHEVQDDKEAWEKMRVVRSWKWTKKDSIPVSYTHLRAHETPEHLVCRLLLEKKKKDKETKTTN